MNSTPVDQTAFAAPIGKSWRLHLLLMRFFGWIKWLFGNLYLHPGLVSNLPTPANQIAHTCETPMELATRPWTATYRILESRRVYDPSVPDTSILNLDKNVGIADICTNCGFMHFGELYNMTSYRHGTCLTQRRRKTTFQRGLL